jgi:predicted phosphoribosyltransferase
MRFRDRADAGRRLAQALLPQAAFDPVVLGLPRGGVPVAAEVAAALHAPLDVVLVHKVSLPWQPEVAVGALGEEGVRLVHEESLRRARVAPTTLALAERQVAERLEMQAQRLRAIRPRVGLTGRRALLVDDGIATGATAGAACEVVRRLGASYVVLAAPVAPAEVVEDLRRSADEVVVLDSPRDFWAVGQAYDDFSATSDAEVERLLAEQPAT